MGTLRWDPDRQHHGQFGRHLARIYPGTWCVSVSLAMQAGPSSEHWALVECDLWNGPGLSAMRGVVSAVVVGAGSVGRWLPPRAACRPAEGRGVDPARLSPAQY